MRRWSLYKGPTVEPIHLTDAKINLAIAVDSQSATDFVEVDNKLSRCISQARAAAETETWNAIVLQAWDLYLDEWPFENEIEFPMPPLRHVEYIKYTDTEGTETEFTDYTVDIDSLPGRIVLDYGAIWPTAILATNNPIHIRFWCGHVVPFTASSTTDILSAPDHPYSDGDVVQLSVSGGSLPGGLDEKTNYYIRDAAAGSLKLAPTAGGSAIDLTTNGTGNMFIGIIPFPIIAGMELKITDLYEERGDTVVNRSGNSQPTKLPCGASYWFDMAAIKRI